MEKQKLTDNELVELYKKGDNKAFEELLFRHKSGVYKYIFSFTHNRELTDDFFQDTIIKAIHSLQHDNYVESGKFQAWLKRIAYNLIIDHFSNEKRISKFSVDAMENNILNNYKFSEKSVEDVMHNEQVLRDVVKLVNYLPQPQQSVVWMRFFEGLNFNEIASKADVSVNTALGRMRYALLNIRRIVTENEINIELR